MTKRRRRGETLRLPRRAHPGRGHDHPQALRAAADTFGAERLLLGCDFPSQAGERFRAAVGYVQRAGLAREQVEAILERNAARLLGLQ